MSAGVLKRSMLSEPKRFLSLRKVCAFLWLRIPTARWRAIITLRFFFSANQSFSARFLNARFPLQFCLRRAWAFLRPEQLVDKAALLSEGGDRRSGHSAAHALSFSAIEACSGAPHHERTRRAIWTGSADAMNSCASLVSIAAVEKTTRGQNNVSHNCSTHAYMHACIHTYRHACIQTSAAAMRCATSSPCSAAPPHTVQLFQLQVYCLTDVYAGISF